MVECLTSRHVLAQIDIIRGHQRSGTIFLVHEEGIYLSAFVFWCLVENLIHDIGRQLLEHVYHVVEIQRIDDVLDLGIGDNIDNLNLVVNVKVCKYLDRNVLR